MLTDTKDAEGFYTTGRAAESTGSQQSWATAVKWLDRCHSDHSECLVSKEPPWYPTRLLDVGGDGNDSIRLVIAADSELTGGYISLSHCWGNAVFLKLKKATFHDLTSGIQLSDLPLTFQQAVEIARRLQKRYIWIDSLCIFQDDDDKSDWLQEAALMHKVYTNAYLNIAATGATDSYKGLFMVREPDHELKPTKVSCPVSFDDEEPGPFRTFILTDVMFFERELMNAPLNRRGWVLQERLLAPRVLHFGSRQLFWECKRGLSCERYPDNLPDYMYRLLSTTFKSLDMSKRRTNKSGLKYASDVPQGPNSDLVIYNLWTRIARAYSSTQLSFVQDKAIALSGIAKAMQDTFQDTYIAGLWRRCLPSQLLWHVNKLRQSNGQPSVRPNPYRAPTWSWLSVDGEISPGSCHRQGLFITVLDVTLTHQNADTTGLILSGTLTLKGRLRPLELRPLTLINTKGQEIELPGRWNLFISGKSLQLPPDSGAEEYNRWSTLVHLDVPAQAQSASDIESDNSNTNNDEQLFVMLGGGPRSAIDDPFIDGDVNPFHDMLLLRCIDRENGVFVRFGLATLDTVEKAFAWSILLERDADEVAAGLPCVEYDRVTREHVIKIV